MGGFGGPGVGVGGVAVNNCMNIGGGCFASANGYGG